MSENLFATILTLVILVGIYAWVPVLNLVCQPCSRFLERRRKAELAAYPAKNEEAA